MADFCVLPKQSDKVLRIYGTTSAVIFNSQSGLEQVAKPDNTALFIALSESNKFYYFNCSEDTKKIRNARVMVTLALLWRRKFFFVSIDLSFLFHCLLFGLNTGGQIELYIPAVRRCCLRFDGAVRFVNSCLVLEAKFSDKTKKMFDVVLEYLKIAISNSATRSTSIKSL